MQEILELMFWNDIYLLCAFVALCVLVGMLQWELRKVNRKLINLETHMVKLWTNQQRINEKVSETHDAQVSMNGTLIDRTMRLESLARLHSEIIVKIKTQNGC